jgi:uncharacterized membrane protein
MLMQSLKFFRFLGFRPILPGFGQNRLKNSFKLILAIVLSLVLAFGQAHSAEAASRGGRVGGGSFRSAPSRTYRAPSRTYSPSPVSPYGGGSVGFNPFFFLPFFGFGGGGLGGLFGLMVLLAIGGFIVRTLQSVLTGNEDGGLSVPGLNNNPSVSVAKVQVGLSSQAQHLQTDLNRIALSANTNTKEGLIKVLQETTLSLLRNPEYWCYGNAQSLQTKLQEGEARFNRFLLEERSKLSGESLSNVGGNLQRSSTVTIAAPTLEQELTIVDSRTYIVVTLLVGIEGKLSLASITNEADLKQAIQLLGSISADQLLSLEILWAPQAEKEVMTADELVAQYPDLKLI